MTTLNAPVTSGSLPVVPDGDHRGACLCRPDSRRERPTVDLEVPRRCGGRVSRMPHEPVEFVLNCFERNIDDVTSPGFLTRAVAQHQHPFAIRTLLVNNVNDESRAATLAQRCVERGEIDRFLLVSDLRERGMRATNLRASDFGRYLHWSDCCVAALVADGPDLLCYVDVDLALLEPHDWIATALDVMSADPRVAVGNPAWVTAGGETSALVEADEVGQGYVLGYGFADQVFLVRRSTFGRPLRRRWLPLWLDCPATVRWVYTPGGAFFEQFADGYMRRQRLMRVTVLGARFEPVPMSNYSVKSFRERVRRRRDLLMLDALTRARRRWPGRVTSPRLRTTGLLDPAYTSGTAS